MGELVVLQNRCVGDEGIDVIAAQSFNGRIDVGVSHEVDTLAARHGLGSRSAEHAYRASGKIVGAGDVACHGDAGHDAGDRRRDIGHDGYAENKPDGREDAAVPAEQFRAAGKRALRHHQHDRIEALGDTLAPAGGETFVEATIEDRQADRAGDDEEDEPGVVSQKACFREAIPDIGQ